MNVSRRSRVLAAMALVGTIGLAACGSDDDQAASTGDESTTTTAGEPTAGTVEVTGVDYAFQGIPQKVEAGTEFTFTNGSKTDPHEMALIKIKDGETRPLSELLELPEAESEKFTEFKGVSVAPEPGTDGKVVEGKLVADTPGRYVALCFIQLGTTPEKMMEAMEHEGPPEEDPNAGPPHFTKGMVQEFTVS